MKKCNEIERILHAYRNIQAEIKNLKLDIEELKDDVGISSINFDAVDSGRCDSKGMNSNVENEVLKRERKIVELERQIRSKERLILKVDNALAQLEEEERRFIELRYFSKISMNDLAAKECVDRSTMYKRKDIIIDKMSNLF